MPNYATLKVEFSPDPLSNTTPSWVDITSSVRSADWSAGTQRDLEDPQAGGATIILRNDQRRFEPEYAAGAFYPNIVPLRRFRLTVTADGVAHGEGVFYATRWDVAYPAGTDYSEVTVSLVDGFGLLTLDLLGPLDPPDAASYSDVVTYDEPFVYLPLNDAPPTTLAAARPPRQHKHHHSKHHQHHRRHNPFKLNPWPAGGVSGPAGQYMGMPLLGQAPLVLGGIDPSALLLTSPHQWVKIPLDASTGRFADTNAFTVEYLTRGYAADPGYGTGVHVVGPWNTGAARPLFVIASSGTVFEFQLSVTGPTTFAIDSVTAPSTSTAQHVCGVWDGNTASLYINGVLEASLTSSANLLAPDANDALGIGGGSHNGQGAAAWISDAAFYEKPLSPKRILAHAQAALTLGYPQQVEGDRVTAIITSDLWSESKIDTGQFQIEPVMQAGQGKFDELSLTTHAAEPWALLWFDGAGDPVYRGWDYLSVGSRSTVTATFGDVGGEVPYTSITLTYDDEIYNSVQVSGKSGLVQTASDTTSQAAYRTRVFSETGVALAVDADAASVAGAIRDGWANPMFRCDAITLNGAQSLSRTQILTRDIGDLIRVRRRGTGGTPIDVVTRILGKSKSFDLHGNLTCTWSLARGFNAADGYWHEGVTGFTELGQTTVLA